MHASTSARPACRRRQRSCRAAAALGLLAAPIALAQNGPLPTPPTGGSYAGQTPPPPATTPAPAAADPAAPPPPIPEWQDALLGGKFTFDLRLRFENVHQDIVGPQGRRGQGHASTGRLRLGYGTKPLAGFSAFGELEAGQSIDDDTYFATVDGDNSDGVIADPDFAEINQLYGQYQGHGFLLRGGRQRITLDDHRFVGNVGWRNDEQTFDALSVNYTGIEGFALYYAYLMEIERIFGDEQDRDSDSHLVNIAWTGAPLGKLVGFAYLLDHRGDADLFDGDTFGIRYQPAFDLSEELKLDFILSYARQVDAGVGEAFEADYYLIEAFLTHKPSTISVGAGYEVLGSDDGSYGFQTPLATLHAFNGYADLFLTTPAFGLEDFYAYVSAKLPWDVNGKVIGHLFNGQDADVWLGWEVDVILTKPITKNITALAKLAWFEGETSAAATAPSEDTIRFWIQMEIKF